VATARSIVDEEGADALSMRTLAERLGSGTATLYRHFANRAELVSHVVDAVLGEVEFAPDELAAMGWQDACRRMASVTFDVLRRHKNVAPLLLERVPMGANAMAQRERAIAFWVFNDFPPNLAGLIHATLARYVVAFATQPDHTSPTARDESPPSDVFRGLDAAQFPATSSVAGSLPIPPQQEFSFGLELILRGLAELRTSDGPRRNTPRKVKRQ